MAAGSSRAVASVEHEDGMWVVHLAVLRPDGVVRHRIRAYADRRHAELAATWMERAANRDAGPRSL